MKTRRTTERRLRPSALGMVVAAAALAGPAYAGNLRVGPPLEHHALGDVGSVTSSWLEREIILASEGYVALEAFVDSQPDADELELLIDGTVVASASGFHFTGPLIAPVSAGPHTVRVAFTKDSSTDAGLDTAWVDNVRVVDGGRLIEEHDFRKSVGCVIPGWTRGGYSGGWCATFGPEPREWRSPIEMSYGGYQPAPRSAGITRTITWPSGADNLLVVDYLVDSEQDHDYFRILVDGAEAFSASGRLQAGSAVIPVTGGGHSITLEYLKDESVDEGRDQVLIGGIMASAGGVPFFGGGLAGSELGAPVPGWTSTGSEPTLQWRAAHRRAPRILRGRDDAGRIVDASLSVGEYRPAARTRLLPLVPVTTFDATLAFGANPDGSIALGVELSGEAAAQFVAGGSLVVLVDTVGPSSPLVHDCGLGSARPGPHARRVEIVRSSVDTASVTERVGICGTGVAAWQPVATGESWGVQAALREDGETQGVILEVGMLPAWPDGLGADAPIALGLELFAPPSGGSDASLVARLPWQPEYALREDDTGSWEQVHFGPSELDPGQYPGAWVDLWPGN